MYCPNCSTKVSLDQKFCRTCGFGLEKVAQSIVEQNPGALTTEVETRHDKLERLALIGLSIFGAGVISILLYLVGYKVWVLFGQGKTLAALALIGLTILLGCGLFSVILFAVAQETLDNSSKQRSQPRQDLPESATTGRLPENRIEPVSSVTDPTTELLFAEKRNLK